MGTTVITPKNDKSIRQALSIIRTLRANKELCKKAIMQLEINGYNEHHIIVLHDYHDHSQIKEIAQSNENVKEVSEGGF